jgi:signal peptidase II
MRHFIFIISGIVILLDQVTKNLILKYANDLPLEVFSGFNLVLAWNRGISFGLFNLSSSWVFWIITLLATLVSVGIFVFLWQQKKSPLILPLSMVLGGAIGNIIDRLTLGAVVDFLDFHLYNYHWPAFNVADSAIVVGVMILIWINYRDEKRRS